MKEVYQQSIKEIYKNLNSSSNGLSQEKAKSNLSKYGRNIIKKRKKLRFLKILLSQFNSFLIYILIVAAAASFFIGHQIDGFVISAIVLLNAGIGFFQQFKAEKSIQDLRKLMIPKSRVVRDGIQREISSQDLVPGDIIILEAGDKISADCRIIEQENLEVNEAPLTGESISVSKNSNAIDLKVPLAEQKNLVFTGTQVVRGTAKAIVIQTGMNTIFGKIAENLQGIKEVKTPIEKRLDKFSKQIGFIVLGIVAIILILGVLEKFDLAEMFLTSIALAVSAIPEGLPAVLAISFAISSLLMSKKNVIIRRLPAVEALGSVTVIATDKTGTLTEEKMTIQEFFANNQFYKKENKHILLNNLKTNFNSQKELLELLKISVLCNNSRFEKINNKYEFLGDPTEIALVEAALDLGINKKQLIEKFPSLDKLEFDSQRKMMSVLRKAEGKLKLFSKGAPNKILEKSKYELINGRVAKLTEFRRREIINASKKMESKALRTLGFGYKFLDSKEKLNEEELIFVGISGMIDPPRKEIKKAIQECESAGISVKMITGDSPLTAKAIGEQIGIKGNIITEMELKKMTDQELTKKISSISIFARMTPEQKLRITKILQDSGEIVAITGDGINDVLALKSADVGIAMGKRGTDVARDVSDIVLLDDNFSSIVEGVKEGRKTYDNIKKFTKYLLAVNFSEIALVLYALVLGFPLPLLPLQILWMNLVSDSFPSMSLVFEKQEDVMKTKPRKEKSILSGTFTYIILAGIFAFLVELILFQFCLNKGFEIELTRTLILTTAIIYELLFVYTIRSKKPIFKIGIFSNKWLNYAVIFSLALHLILLYTPLGNIFNLVPLTLNHWLLILPFAFSGLIIFELAKYFLKLKKFKN